MSFLSLFFLTALPLVAAPLVLHLFDRRRNVVIEWGAMQFLLEAATRRTSARKFKQWLLLLLRMLTLAALILALARPLIPGNWFGSQERTEIILVLDNSLSMSRLHADEALFAMAVNRAEEILGETPPEDLVRILTTSPFPEWVTAGSVRADAGNKELLTQQLTELKSTAGGSDLLSALFTAVQAERESLVQQRRIVVLTDGQATDWRFRDETGWERLQQALKSASLPTGLEIERVADDQSPGTNLALNELRTSRLVAGPNQPVKLVAIVQNHGPGMSEECLARCRVGEEEVLAVQVPALDAGASHEVLWAYEFERPGTYSLSCQLDAAEPLTTDNSANVVVEVVEQIPFLLVEGSPTTTELQRDAFCIQAALGRVDGEELSAHGIHAPTVIDPERLEFIDLAPYRAIVLPNLTLLTEKQAERLRDFVSEGGGLWIGLGPRTDVDAFNQQLYSDGHGLAPLAAEHIEDTIPESADAETATPVTLSEITSKHPATVELSEGQQLDLASVRVDRHFRFVPPPDGANVSVLLSDTRGEPIAVEKYFGRGRVITQGLPLKLQWSDLARSQSFVVLVQNWLDYLSQPRATRHNLFPGDPISVQLAQTDSREATLFTPDGEELPLTGEAVGDGVMFRSGRTSSPGDYRLEVGLSGDRIPFHVQRDPAESNLAMWSRDEEQVLADVRDIGRQQQAAESSVIAQHQPLWPSLIVLLILFLIAELFLASQIARDRFGSTPIAETTDAVGMSSEQYVANQPFGTPPASGKSPVRKTTRA